MGATRVARVVLPRSRPPASGMRLLSRPAAELVHPTARGRARMAAADGIMADLRSRHAGRIGAEAYAEFVRLFQDVVGQQRRAAGDLAADGPDARNPAGPPLRPRGWDRCASGCPWASFGQKSVRWDG